MVRLTAPGESSSRTNVQGLLRGDFDTHYTLQAFHLFGTVKPGIVPGLRDKWRVGEVSLGGGAVRGLDQAVRGSDWAAPSPSDDRATERLLRGGQADSDFRSIFFAITTLLQKLVRGIGRLNTSISTLLLLHRLCDTASGARRGSVRVGGGRGVEERF